MTDLTRAERVRQATESLRGGALLTLREQAAVLEDAFVELLRGRLTEDQRDAARRAAHTVAGTAGIFGYHRATALGQQLQAYLAEGAPMSGAKHAASLVEELHVSLVPADDGNPGVPGEAARSVGQ